MRAVTRTVLRKFYYYYYYNYLKIPSAAQTLSRLRCHHKACTVGLATDHAISLCHHALCTLNAYKTCSISAAAFEMLKWHLTDSESTAAAKPSDMLQVAAVVNNTLHVLVVIIVVAAAVTTPAAATIATVT